MAIDRTAKGRFLVVIPDKNGQLDTRMQVRSQHKEGIKPLVEAGVISLGGPTLISHAPDGEEQQINGSVILVNGKTKTEVLEIVQRDVYSTSGVWDLDKMQIIALGF